MRPSQSDWIIRECTSALDHHHRAFVYQCLWAAGRDGSWRLAGRLLLLLLFRKG